MDAALITSSRPNTTLFWVYDDALNLMKFFQFLSLETYPYRSRESQIEASRILTRHNRSFLHKVIALTLETNGAEPNTYQAQISQT